MIFEQENMPLGQLTKFHIRGLPFDAVLHRFTAADEGYPHDHPFGFHTHILAGGYVEEVFEPNKDGTWFSGERIREPGTSHFVRARHIHRIVRLLESECYTLILPLPKEREVRIWRFDETGVASRQWNEAEFV